MVRQGAFVHEGVITWRASEQATPEPVLKVAEIPLKGGHNVENVLAAVCAARLAGVEAAAIRKAVMEFHAVEHRLEFVAKINGVDYYNDSKATNVDASMKAIAAFPGGIHLILGGKDKNSDYRQMRALLQERVKAVYTIGAAAEKIHTHIEGAAPDRERRHARRGDCQGGCGGAAGRDRAAGAGVFELRSVREL